MHLSETTPTDVGCKLDESNLSIAKFDSTELVG